MFETVQGQWALLLGLAAFIALLVNVLKLLKVVKDGTADKWVAGFNLAGMLVIYLLGIFKVQVDLEGVDAQFAELAVVGNFILQYVISLLGSKATYFAVKDLPVIGKSNSVG
jgi:hypothetical protein